MVWNNVNNSSSLFLFVVHQHNIPFPVHKFHYCDRRKEAVFGRDERTFKECSISVQNITNHNRDDGSQLCNLNIIYRYRYWYIKQTSKVARFIYDNKICCFFMNDTKHLCLDVWYCDLWVCFCENAVIHEGAVEPNWALLMVHLVERTLLAPVLLERLAAATGRYWERHCRSG